MYDEMSLWVEKIMHYKAQKGMVWFPLPCGLSHALSFFVSFGRQQGCVWHNTLFLLHLTLCDAGKNAGNSRYLIRMMREDVAGENFGATLYVYEIFLPCQCLMTTDRHGYDFYTCHHNYAGNLTINGITPEEHCG